jgi:transposase
MSSENMNPVTIPLELDAEMTPAVRAFVKLLLDRIAKLEVRVEELERGQKTPQNSSLPPSSQHPHARPELQRCKSKKKRGGQPGHEKHERPLIPTKDCDDVQSLKPAECRRCGGKLSGSDREPLRHQVWELPEIKPIVTEYQRHRLCCQHCGATTCANLPAAVPRGQSGPRLIAFAAILMAYFRQSKRRTAMFLGALLNQPCCPSLVVKMQTLATAAVRSSYEELAVELPKQERLGGDESPTKEGKSKAWLWTLVAPKFTVFAMRRTREATVLDELLTDQFSGVVTCDRAKMYWRLGRLQWCWAHLIRDFQAMIDGGNAQTKWLGYDLRRAAKMFFRHWTDYRNAAISWAAVQRRLAPVRREVERLLRRGLASGNRQMQGTCRELYEHRHWLWTFSRCRGVEPTNNASERALRHAVIWRKLSFGVQSVGGSRFVETTLTVIETCRQQGRHLLSFLTAAVKSHLAHQPAPPLLSGV